MEEQAIEVSVVIPAYEEEEAIGPVIDAVKAAMETTKHAYEILVIDDGSTDKTVEVARARHVQGASAS